MRTMPSSTMPPTTSALTPQQLDTALAKLRASTPVQGLWAQLLAALHTDAVSLATGLREWHGILTISPADEHLLQSLSASLGTALPSAQGLWLSLQAQPLLLCEDPWSSLAAATVLRHPEAQLGLAQAGQLKRLSAFEAVATQTPPPALVSTATSTVLDDSPVVRFVDEAIRRAYRDGASDIHFETDRTGIQVKYRLDGVIARGERYADAQRSEEVISRIKVMAQLDITERRRPQDGRIHWVRQDHAPIDLRVSVMPSIFGEDVVLRLLDKAQLRNANDQNHTMSLDVLGFVGDVASSIRKLATRPHGMLLITGPTGSGKTTTVYAALSEVNDGLEKIITIEDPVEYELEGVLQIPVNEQKGLTFATGLRSILRHDPDKILVGEIRDAETAEIAVQSSLTGHLVFTTVHANSMFDVLGRFQHFGIDPFAFASALNGVVVQRLLRKLCKHCTAWHAVDSEIQTGLAELGISLTGLVPVAQGCTHCRQTGYRGRFVVAEVHVISNEMRDLIISKRSMSELMATVYSDPARRLLAQAVGQVRLGNTTIEEVTRVVGLA